MSILHSIQPTPRESARLRTLPILILNVHNRCNCRCVMCDIWKRTENIEMHAAELERHRESFRSLGVRQVVLTGGEPLMHSHLDAFCAFFRKQNIRLTLLSTGLLLQKRAETVASCFDDVIVSLDGPEAIHDRVRRVPGGFALIGKGILAVRQYAPSRSISCRTTVQKANHNALCSTVQAAKQLNLDRISFLTADVSSQAFNRSEPWTLDRQDEVALSRTELSVLEREIERLIIDYAVEIQTGYIAENAYKLRALTNRFREHLQNAIPLSPQCNAPWVSAVVEVDGTVRPCFFHPPIGTLKTATLQEAINSGPALSFRGSLNVAEHPICQRCVCSLNYRSEG